MKEEFIDKKLEEKLAHLAIQQDEKYSKLGLKFNAFPRSGTANVNSSDFYTKHLVPCKPEVEAKLIDYIFSCFAIDENDKTNKLNTAVITGDYGLGKTQLLMYAKYLLGVISQDARINRKPFVIYIDNPGAKLSEFIGSLINKVGEENFKKFIWNKIIGAIYNNQSFKDRLQKFKNTSFFDDEVDPYSPENSINHKAFLDAWVFNSSRIRQEFNDEFRKIKIEILQKEFENSALAQYFFDIVSNDLGINRSWEALSSGEIKSLDRKEYLILKSIVLLIKEQGFTDFFILVDEFEDITKGRLSKTQVDNYLYNLRLLLDDHREWCLLFAMTGEALMATRKISPPLADRIGMTVITLTKLEPDQIEQLTLSYLNLAREATPENVNDLKPFTPDALKALNETVEGSTRRFLKGCFNLIEKAAEVNQNGELISSEFVLANLNIDLE